MEIMSQLLLFVSNSLVIILTIVSVLEENSDITLSYRYSNQEKANKEIETVFNFNIQYVTDDLSFSNSNLIKSENLSKHDKIASKIFIPPPQQLWYIIDSLFKNQQFTFIIMC